MKILLLALVLLMSCAPMLCRLDPVTMLNYSEDRAPEKYISHLSVSYGALKIPFRLEKDGSKYTVWASRISGLSFDKKGLCFNSVCIDLPIGPDGLIFGALLTGEEKTSCSTEGPVLSRETASYLIRHYFKGGQLSKVEILDKRKKKVIVLSYGPKTEYGYYRRVKVDADDLSFTINVEEVKF